MTTQGTDTTEHPAAGCYRELADVIEGWLALIPPGDDRDALVRMHRHLRAAALMPPLRLVR